MKSVQFPPDEFTAERHTTMITVFEHRDRWWIGRRYCWDSREGNFSEAWATNETDRDDVVKLAKRLFEGRCVDEIPDADDPRDFMFWRNAKQLGLCCRCGGIGTSRAVDEYTECAHCGGTGNAQ